MPTNLTGNPVSLTYAQLLHVDGGVNATLKSVLGGNGTATALRVSTTGVAVDNIGFSGNVLSSLNTNGNIEVTPNGSGRAVLNNADLLPGSTVPFSSLQSRVYAQLSDATDQVGSVSAATKVQFTTVDISVGVTGSTDITPSETGIYLVAPNLQFVNSDSQDHDVTVWIGVSGTNVPRSARRITVPKASDGGAAFFQGAFHVNFVSGQHINILWLPENVSVTLKHTAAGAIAPAVPSATLTVQRIA